MNKDNDMNVTVDLDIFTSELVDDLVGVFPASAPRTRAGVENMKRAYCKYFAGTPFAKVWIRRAVDNGIQRNTWPELPNASAIIEAAANLLREEVNKMMVADAAKAAGVDVGDPSVARTDVDYKSRIAEVRR